MQTLNEETKRSKEEADENPRAAWLRRAVAVPLILTLPLCGFLQVSIIVFLSATFVAVIGAVLLAPDLAALLAKPLTGMFWPDRRIDPTPVYGVPESLVMKGRFAEARKVYEEIILEYPKELKPHFDLVKMAMFRMKDAALAHGFYDRAMKVIQDPEDRETIRRFYERVTKEMASPPAHTADRTIEFRHVGQTPGGIPDPFHWGKVGKGPGDGSDKPH